VVAEAREAVVRPTIPRRQLWGRVLLIVPALLVLGLFFVLPYLNMVLISFYSPTARGAYIPAFTIVNYRTLLTDALTWQVIWRTLWIGGLTTVLTLILSYPLAYHLARARSGIKGLLMILIVAPLLVGVLIRTYGWMIILQNTGLLNQALGALHLGPFPFMYNTTGVIIGLVHVYIPFMVLSLTGSLQAIHPDLERAARSLGAGPWRAFWRITVPLSLPGVQAGCILVFVLAVSSYVIPSLLGGFTVLTVPILVVRTITELFNWPGGSAFALLFFAITLFVVWVYLRLMSRIIRIV
jgi:putative spermidine/putrescine transport system permease protein